LKTCERELMEANALLLNALQAQRNSSLRKPFNFPGFLNML
jgi:hypothetical protein